MNIIVENERRVIAQYPGPCTASHAMRGAERERTENYDKTRAEEKIDLDQSV